MPSSFELIDVADCEALSALTKRSKAYWGYSHEQMLEWDEELTLTPSYLDQHQGAKLLINEQLIGYYSWRQEGKAVFLDNLFVEPMHIGKGYGKSLLQHLVGSSMAGGHTLLKLESDPHAEGFYAYMGFNSVGLTPSSIPGRNLVQMERRLV